MDIPTVADILQKTYTARHRRMLIHFNPLKHEITQHLPPAQTFHKGDTQISHQFKWMEGGLLSSSKLFVCCSFIHNCNVYNCTIKFSY
jgi:hypothetical protein